jgi:hypothetical protein
MGAVGTGFLAESMVATEICPAISAADLKFLHHARQTRSGRNAACRDGDVISGFHPSLPPISREF